MKPWLILLLAAGLHLQAQKPSPGPHGGELKKAGVYWMELVDCTSYVQLYLYELDMCPLKNYDISGSVDFYYPGSDCFTSPLYPYGIESFTAEARQPCYTRCRVFVHSRGLSISADFGGYEYNDEDCRPLIRISPGTDIGH